jgi:hypothetical protein
MEQSTNGSVLKPEQESTLGHKPIRSYVHYARWGHIKGSDFFVVDHADDAETLRPWVRYHDMFSRDFVDNFIAYPDGSIETPDGSIVKPDNDKSKP